MAATNPFDPSADPTAASAAKMTTQNMTTQPVPNTSDAAAPSTGTSGTAAPTAGTNTGGTNIAPTGTAAQSQAPSTGILSSAMNTPVTAPVTAGTTANATTNTAGNTAWNVTAPQTVAGQLNTDLAAGSPLFEKAQADAAQTANGRGLLNSSMAAGAGTAALLDKALQIATPDAQANAAAGAANAQSQNQTAQFNAGAANTTSLANAQSTNAAISQDAAAKQQAATTNLSAGIQTATTAYQGALQTALANASEADKVTLSNTDAQVRTNLAQIQAQYQTQMQSSQSAATMYSQTMNTIGQIMQDPTANAEAKSNLIQQTMDAFKAGLNIQFAITNIPGVASLVSNLGAPGSGATVGTGAAGNGQVVGSGDFQAPSATPGGASGDPAYGSGEFHG